MTFKNNKVGPKGFEPMTSALSKQRSKPTELRSHFETAKFRNDFGISKEEGIGILKDWEIIKFLSSEIRPMFKLNSIFQLILLTSALLPHKNPHCPQSFYQHTFGRFQIS